LELIFTYHPVWILACLLIAFSYSFFLYRKDSLLEEVKKSLKWLMAIFRFIAVFFVCLLLLGIVLENFIDRKEKPIVFVVNDNSESVLNNSDSSFYKNDFTPSLSKFSKGLEEKFEVINYSFSDEIYTGLGGDYNGKTTNISNVFNDIFDQYTNRNIGGIVLASDGIYNNGSNPIYALERRSFLPIFTIGLGDTNEVRDVKIDFVKHNDIAFIGNEFPVSIGVGQTKCDGETVKLEIIKNGKVIAEENVSFDDLNRKRNFEFKLKANSIGFQKYTVRVSQLDEEFSVKNNESNFYIEVIDGRQKVLIVHDGPHPDISAIRSVIESNKNYEVDVKAIEEVKGLGAYDLGILHNYSAKNKSLSEEIKDGKTPCLFIVGNNTNIPALSEANAGVSGSKSDVEDVGFEHNSAFKEMLLSPKIIQLLSSAPPLQSPFGNFKFSAAAHVLAYQKIGNITLSKPLIYFNQNGASRFGTIFGEGIWRWKLHDQLKNSTTDNFEEFISKMITYLAVKENKDPFKVKIESEYNESQSVLVRAELYNQSYELINEPEVKFSYSKDDGKIFEPSFVRSSNAYQLDLGRLEQGIYNWKATTDFQGTHYEKEGTFLVKEIKLELLDAQANHRLLMNMAENSDGDFYGPRELDVLADDINTRDDLVTVVYQEKKFDDLIDYKILFFLIMGLLAVEWFFRKFNGAY
jgi:hypothetical protein